MDLKPWSSAFVAHARGGGGTRAAAAVTFRDLSKFCERKGWGGVRPDNITPKQARLYLESLSARGLNERTIQNRASHLRRAVEGAGRKLGDVREDKNAWSSSRLNVPEGSRLGGRAAADVEKWAAADLSRSARAVACLSESVGLRRQEAILAGASLKSWSRELAAAKEENRGAFLPVVFGTKGGRERMTYIHAEHIDKASYAVHQALEVAVKNSIYDAPTLKAALANFSAELSRAGLKGTDSIHGLRRAFAHASYKAYRESGLDEKQALARLSRDLGHGEQRGRWVSNNYLSGNDNG